MAEQYFSPERIFNHSRFSGFYSHQHPKWISLKKVLDRGMGNNNVFKSTIRIKLPYSDCDFTAERTSGHKPVTLINDEVKNAKGKIVHQLTTIILVFDIMANKMNTGQRYSERTDFDDDFELG